MTQVAIARPRTEAHTVTYFHAHVTAYTPSPSGGSYCHYLQCSHNHVSPEAADACGDRLARDVERRPHRHIAPEYLTEVQS